MAGISWISAGGDSSKVADARMKIIQGVIGMIVIVASYAVIGLIGTIVGINILNPAQLLSQLVP